ncbi:hypothetical protein RDI58_026896 [Solanum bulbocastanum]|uniref:Pentatricopeptide repeat-containing protein n=1 Tax=Solanum bulbocastanum TaxID=147425 RepID=A0AAN8SUG8_SOLBU
MPYEAVSFYSRLKHVGSYICDQFTYSFVIKACVETKQILVGNVVHSHILHSGIRPSRIVGNSLFNMYSASCLTLDNGSGCDLVERVFRTMCKRNIVAWNTIFSCCIDLATKIFKNTCETNTEIWNSMISGCIQNNFPFKAVDLFLEAVEVEDIVTTDDVTFVSALMAVSAGNTQNGLIKQSFAVFKEMLEQNVKPNVVTLTSILPSCRQLGSIAIGKYLHCFAICNLFENYVYVVSALNSLELDVVTFVAVLSTCSYTGMEDLDGWMKLMIFSKQLGVKEGSDGISGYHVLLSNIYAEEGYWQSIDNIRRGMHNMGFSKEVGYSWY